ncbi:MAG: glutamate--tRNA ligase [Candidatus Krumholzibacteriota bacterium]|nr:glutamate--tRNA ligase [Candidatus Krumholzibacteriota bacterium]
MNTGSPRVRFAPSPTGHLHIGGARTALFNWLYARKTGGTFVLRIEDTDAERSTKESYEAILDAMTWLGLDWDEGPGKEGRFGPYLQSARTVVYHNETEKLLESGGAYRCFCTPDELDELRREAIESGRAPKYDGRCRRLPSDEVDDRVARGIAHVVRFRMEPGETKFRDVIRGEFTFNNDDLDDFVIRKSDGNPTYNFAVVVDDAKMEITHVIRGDDHLSNTPRQVAVYRALGYRLPRFAHLPMILGSDKSRLSKRHGAASVQEFRDLGYSPDGLLNYLALLGWSLDGSTEFFTRSTLIDKFSLKRVTKNPAAFDENKLKHINAEHFKRLDPLKKVSFVYRKLVEEKILPADFEVEEYCANGSGAVATLNGEVDPAHKDVIPRLGFIVNVMGNRLGGVTEVPAMLRYFFKDDFERESGAYEKYLSGADSAQLLERLATVLEGLENFSHADIERAVRSLAEELGVKAGDLIHPCRVALTGGAVSPDIFAVVQLLGRAKSVERLRDAATTVARQSAG